VRLAGLAVRGFRNLRDQELGVPARGATITGANGQGKTSLLEAIYFPVLFRSLRGAPDPEIVRFGETGFHVAIGFESGARARQAFSTFRLAGRQKHLELDGVPLARMADAAGAWLAVTFLPDDVRLAAGPAAGRRLFLDRTLALSDRYYLAALSRYRRALAQRNAALRAARPGMARAFDPPLAAAGSEIVARRLAWVAGSQARFAEELFALGERLASPVLSYAGSAELADPAAWPERLEASAGRDQARGLTAVGPHRDDLTLCLAGHRLREFGSIGQQRTAAIALKLLELETLRRAAGESPVLLLDDIFAELDGERRRRLRERLVQEDGTQIFITSPRPEDFPDRLGLERWRVDGGVVSPGP
jgi:DNA replication and repair protein RecF